MKIAFFGLGGIGTRHLNLLREEGGHEFYAVRSGAGDVAVDCSDIRTVKHQDELLAHGIELAFITNPTRLHIPCATWCAEHRIPFFVEKPLSDQLVELDGLCALVRESRIATYVGYVLRFHPVIQRLRELLADREVYHARCVASSFLPLWRPGRDHLKLYSAQRALGGGVIPDLSHELDYMGWLMGGVVQIDGNFARRSTVTVDAEDYADIVLQCARGPVNVHLNFLSQVHRREITVDCPGVTYVADLVGSVLRVYKGYEAVEEHQLPIERDELFRRQLQFFLSHRDDPRMMNNVEEAAELLIKVVEWRERRYGQS